MKRYELKEGEGVAGFSGEIAARTTGLANCMGITMVNEEGFVGLFHYPGMALNKVPGVQSAILQMLNDVQPDRIYVTPARQVSEVKSTSGFNGSSHEDIKAVLDFLRESGRGTPVTESKASSFASFQHDGKTLRLDEMLPDCNPVDLSEAAVFTAPGSNSKAPQSRRFLGPNILYYNAEI